MRHNTLRSLLERGSDQHMALDAGWPFPKVLTNLAMPAALLLTAELFCLCNLGLFLWWQLLR